MIESDGQFHLRNTGGLNTSRPHSARVWNYWLGGGDYYPIDKDAAEQYITTAPEMVDIPRLSRMALTRAIRHLATDHGVRQFLDIGVGLSTIDNTHDIALDASPDSKIVYVDNEPMVMTHARGLLTGPPGAIEYVMGDVRDPDAILQASAGILRPPQPVAVIMSWVLGHIPDDQDARGIISRLAAGLPAGSALVLIDGVSDLSPGIILAQGDYNQLADPYELRDADRIARLLDGLDLLAPGLTTASAWHPEAEEDDEPPAVQPLVALARRP